MEIKEAYLVAMSEQAPEMLRELREKDELDAHLQAVSEQANRMFDQLTEGAAKLPNGVVRDPSLRASVERQILSTLIEFPSRFPSPPDASGEQIPQPQAA